MNEIDIWIGIVLNTMSYFEILNYGNTKHQAVANFYRIQLGLPVLKSHEEAILFIDELFRIPFQELVSIPALVFEQN